MGNRSSIVVASLAALSIAAPALADYTFSTLASFNSTDGALPEAGVTLIGGNLYGTASSGGPSGGGVVFSVPVTGGTPAPLAAFNFSGSSGHTPVGATIPSLSGTTLYGTTTAGGFNGSVFSVPIGGGTPTTLATFSGPGPNANLVLSGSNLYGTTMNGGSSLQGTVFSVPSGGGTPTTLATFSGTNGSDPEAGLIVSGSTLYGTTSNGAGFAGSVFSLPIGGGSPTTLGTFNSNGSNGSFPRTGLILSGTTLYGTTALGPGGTIGSIFSLPIGGGTPTTLATFNGSTPIGDLVLVGNTLFGTTQGGGADGDGTVFSVPITGGVPTTIFSFTGQNTNGNTPDDLFADGAGDLFGTIEQGGTGSIGSVFELSQAVPEPTSLALLGLGAMGLLGRRRPQPL